MDVSLHVLEAAVDAGVPHGARVVGGDVQVEAGLGGGPERAQLTRDRPRPDAVVVVVLLKDLGEERVRVRLATGGEGALRAAEPKENGS
jgi:hypothetical protein